MPNRIDFGSVNLNANEKSASGGSSPETPFQMAILGDFSGRSSRGIIETATIARRRPILIDRDNCDDVLKGFSAEILLAVEEHASLTLRFSEIDDFHPDHLFQTLEIFRKLRELRARLEDPSTFQETANELVPASSSKVHTDSTTVAAPSAARLSAGSLLDDMIAQTESRADSETARRTPNEIQDFARALAQKYAEPTPDARQPQFLGLMDRATTGLMRALLHNPDFQALEALWRGVFHLVRRVETGQQLKLHLVDISKKELAADLSSVRDLKETGIYRLLVEPSVNTPGAESWAVLVGNYMFGADQSDLTLLRRIASVAKQARAPFLAGASSQLLGCSSLASSPHPREWESSSSPQWSELRGSPEAEWIGLALPRLLLRMPYGKKTSQLESFDFDELPDGQEHEAYLWGNSSLALATMLAESFSEEGWAMRPGTVCEIRDLPLHVYEVDGLTVAKPCAEALLTEDAIERILENGLIPMVSFKNRDVIRVPRFQSISDPPRALMGPWAS